MQIKNTTPFAAGQSVLLDKDGAETLILALKATFEIASGGELVIAPKQEPLSFVDEFLEEPGESSVIQESEMEPPKPATDVFLTGRAIAPRPDTREMEVSLRVGPVSRRALVTGPRVWRRRMGMTRSADPEPFEEIPLLWENAFGGADDSVDPVEWEPTNPIGRGIFARKTKAELVGMELPSIEDPVDRLKKPGQRVKAVGFGPTGRHWEPRKNYAGTYDEAWQEERAPLLPEDFDPRFFQVAPPDLIAAGHLKGDEPVEVVGCLKAGRLVTALPGLRLGSEIRIATRAETPALALNTVHLDLNRMLLTLLYKGAVRIHGEALRLKRTTFFEAGEAS